MRCAWQALINLLPIWMRNDVDRLGKESLQEIRLRLNQQPELVTSDGRHTLGRPISIEDLGFCINVTSRYSPWSTTSISKGYITAPGGHRVGICGEAVLQDKQLTGIRTPSSLSIRVARDFPGLADGLIQHSGSILIIGAPGSGKTTLLRDIIRQRSDVLGEFVSVVDERQEIFPYANKQLCFPPGKHTDILSACSKNQGIEVMLRNMTPQTIAVDEITAQGDCIALLHAGWCGVKMIATAHAGSRYELEKRPVYRPLLDSCLFDTLLVLNRDKTWSCERMNI